MKKSLKLLSISLLFLGSNAFAQELTLKQCIDRASTNNLTIKQQITAIQSSEISLKQTKSQALPTVSAYAEEGIVNAEARKDGSTYETTRKTYNNAQLGVTSQIDLWNGHKVKYEIEKQRILLDASKMTQQATLQDIVIYVTSSFLDVVYQTENVRTIENQMAVTKEQVERTRIMVDAGAMAKFELSRMLMQQAQEKAVLVDAKTQLAQSILTLGQLLDIKGDSVNKLKVSVPVLPEIENIVVENPDSIFSIASKTYPELKAQQLVLQSYESDVKIAKSTGLPNVYLKGQVYTGYDGITYSYDDPTSVTPYGSQIGDNLNAQIVLGINVPIFNKHNTKWSVAQSRIAKSTAQFELEQKQNDLYKKAQSVSLEAISAQEQYKARTEAAKLANESFVLAQEKFNAGTMDGISFIIEKNNLAQSQSDLLLSKYQLLFKLKQIDLLLGKEISL